MPSRGVEDTERKAVENIPLPVEMAKFRCLLNLVRIYHINF